MKDLRDPNELGQKLLHVRANAPHIELHEIADHAGLNVRDYVDEGPLERYGNPVAKHEAAIKAGKAARLP